ncbi:MAG: CRISPR-associated endonuclease Cas3'' [Candidatus Nezhaarchaeales archaeon]
MINPVYSFYQIADGSLKAERLRTHIEHALMTFNEDCRLIRYGRSLRESFYNILKYTIILHDFGKVPFNQAAFQTGWNIKKMSFEGHEVLSAWFANEYLDRAVGDGVVGHRDVPLAVLAILLHHHPMDEKIRADRLSRNKNICISEETVETFYKELEGIITPASQIPLKSPICAPDIAYQVFGNYGLFSSYWSSVWMNGSPTERKVFLLLTQGLIAADYKSASLTRGEGTSEFAKTIQVYLNYYGSINAGDALWST